MSLQLPAAPLAQRVPIPECFADGPRLLADIGGTNARFALETGPGRIEAIAVFPCKDYAALIDAVRTYLCTQPLAAVALKHAAFAIANPLDGDQVRMTNHDWAFSVEALRRGLGLETLLMANDFKALAMALPHLAPEHKRQVGGGIVPRLGDRFAQSGFRRRFEQKGRFSACVAQIPTYVITAEYPAFSGVAAILAAQLRAR